MRRSKIEPKIIARSGRYTITKGIAQGYLYVFELDIFVGMSKSLEDAIKLIELREGKEIDVEVIDGNDAVCKSISVEDTLETRGKIYGEFKNQIECVGKIVSAMIDCANANEIRIDMDIQAEWHYLAIKLARIAANPNYTDSYHDLAGYATLMERERVK